MLMLSLYVHAEIIDKQIKNNDDFVWAIEVPLTGKFIIDVEFFDLKITSPDVCICYIPLFSPFLRITSRQHSQWNYQIFNSKFSEEDYMRSVMLFIGLVYCVGIYPFN